MPGGNIRAVAKCRTETGFHRFALQQQAVATPLTGGPVTLASNLLLVLPQSATATPSLIHAPLRQGVSPCEKARRRRATRPRATPAALREPLPRGVSNSPTLWTMRSFPPKWITKTSLSWNWTMKLWKRPSRKIWWWTRPKNRKVRFDRSHRRPGANLPDANGRNPAVESHQEISSAKQIEKTRTRFRRSLLASDYILQGAMTLLQKVRDGELRLDRTVDVSVTDASKRNRSWPSWDRT